MPASSRGSSVARDRVRTLAAGQGSVIARRQVLAAGLCDDWIARQLANKRWRRVHPGVYATVTGLLSLEGRWFAALLYAGKGAALADDAALQAAGMRIPVGDGDAITVAIDHDRRVRSTDGVRVIRVKNLAWMVHPARWPAQLRLEDALLLKASRARRARRRDRDTRRCLSAAVDNTGAAP